MLWIRKQRHGFWAIKLHVEDDFICLNERVFRLDQLKSRNDFRSFVRFIFPMRQGSDSRTIEDAHGGRHFYPHALKFFDQFSMTYNSKVTPEDMAELEFNYFCTSISVFFYPETQSFKDALFLVSAPDDPNTPFEITTTDNNGKMVPYLVDELFDSDIPRNHFLPKCEVTASKDVVDKAGTKITFTYKDIKGEAQKINFKATAKSDSGYISHRKFNVVDGVGSFYFFPMGLSKGEDIKIQIGIGNFTEVVSIDLKSG